MGLVLVYVCSFISLTTLGLAAYPPLTARVQQHLRVRAAEAGLQLEDMFVTLSHQRLLLLQVLLPLGLALAGGILAGHVLGAVAGAVLALPGPRLFLRIMKQRRQQQFHSQLVDSLLLLSSCLRAGLSMTQAFTVIAEEMPVPANQEFGLLLKETRMGVSLDEAMLHFRDRVPSDDTNLFVTTVLVARETGGDVTAIFTRLVETLRERKKIKEKIRTLTFMSKLQGIIMAMLPIVFIFVTFTADKSHFGFFMHDPMGQMMLAGVVVAQIFGMLLFARFSRSPI